MHGKLCRWWQQCSLQRRRCSQLSSQHTNSDQEQYLQVVGNQLKKAVPPALSIVWRGRGLDLEGAAPGPCKIRGSGPKVQTLLQVHLKVKRRRVSRVARGQQAFHRHRHATEGALKDQAMCSIAKHLRVSANVQLRVGDCVGYAGVESVLPDGVEADQQDGNHHETRDDSHDDCKAADPEAPKSRGCR